MYPQHNQQQQQQGLPFRVDGPENGPYQIDVNRPSFIPSVQIASWLQPYLGYISGVMMDVISRNHQTGPISMGFYNFMSKNNWMNNDFVQAVGYCADSIYMENSNFIPNPNDISNIIARSVMAFVELRTLYLIKQFQGLWSYIAEPDKRNIQQAHYAFEVTLQNIDQMRASTPNNVNVGQPVGNPYGMPPQGHPQQQFMHPGQQQHQMTSAMYHAGQQGMPMHAQQMGGMAAPGGGRSYESNAPVPVQPAQQLIQPQQAQVPSQAPKGPAMSAPNAQASNLIDPSKYSWRFTPEVPYPPAYNPITHELMYSMSVDGVAKPILQPGKINVIDYERHDIGTIFGKPPANTAVVKDNTAINAQLQEGIRDIAEEMLTVDEAGKQIEFNLTMRDVLPELSLDTAILVARSFVKLNHAEIPMVYRVLAHVYTPIIGEVSDEELIKTFRQSNSYIELREKLKAAGETASIEIVQEANMRMTKHMNHILHKRISILPEDITVDDFTIDLDELMETLKNTYGDNVLKAFLKDQRQNITSLFRTVDQCPTTEDGQRLHANLTGDILRDSWEGRFDDPPAFTFIGASYSLTMLNVISHDLQVAGIPKIGNGLSSRYQPVLYNLAKNIFDAENVATPIAHHLVITKDGRVLEVTRGDLGQDWFLVSLYH